MIQPGGRDMRSGIRILVIKYLMVYLIANDFERIHRKGSAGE